MLILGPLISRAQEKPAGDITSGTITFEEKIKIDIKLEGVPAEMADKIPKERKSVKLLHFTPAATLFEDGKNVDDDMMMEQGEGIRVRMMGSADNKLYTNLKENKIIEQRDFMNRMFLIERSPVERNWKITGNQKVILGYPCMEATTQDTAGIKTTVWFAPGLSVKGGPANLGNLPGMVLEADINNGSRTYIAQTIDPVSEADLDLQKPKNGKKVSEKEYNELVAEKMKEMGIEGGQPGSGGAQVRIMIKN